MLKYKKAHEKYAAKDERWGVFFYAGIGFVEPMVEGLKRAGGDLTRESFVKAMEGIQNFKGIFGRIDYSASLIRRTSSPGRARKRSSSASAWRTGRPRN